MMSEKHGSVVIYVGRAKRSPRIDGLYLRPHKIRPHYPRKSPRKPKASTDVQKTLFDLTG